MNAQRRKSQSVRIELGKNSGYQKAYPYAMNGVRAGDTVG